MQDLGKYFSTENEIPWNEAVKQQYKSLNLDDLENLIKDAINYLRHYFTEEEVREWLKAPYDLPNLGIRVYEHSSQIK